MYTAPPFYHCIHDPSLKKHALMNARSPNIKKGNVCSILFSLCSLHNTRCQVVEEDNSMWLYLWSSSYSWHLTHSATQTTPRSWSHNYPTWQEVLQSKSKVSCGNGEHRAAYLIGYHLGHGHRWAHAQYTIENLLTEEQQSILNQTTADIDRLQQGDHHGIRVRG